MTKSQAPLFIKVQISLRMMERARDIERVKTHRELVEREFLKRDYVVTDHLALQYFELRDNGNRPAGFVVEGVPGVSVQRR
jgi:hypothetical protein